MPTINAYEENRDAVLADLAQGRFDYLEVASEYGLADRGACNHPL